MEGRPSHANKMKVIAFYLPQFHSIPENDEWWGKDFTEWVNMKKAESLFDGHYQPRIPLNKNYYNLLDDNVKEWQVKIAKEHGVSAFCFYHYWFSGHMLLEKPVEQFLSNKELDIEFCLSWANETWTNAWVSSDNKILIEQKYGLKEEWKKHFDYLLPFFKDERYLKEEDKPLFIIYKPDLMECRKEMMEYWNELAKDAGFAGMKFAYQHPAYAFSNAEDKNIFDYSIEYQPAYARYWMSEHKKSIISLKTKNKIADFMKHKLKISVSLRNEVEIVPYEDVWSEIVQHHGDGSGKVIPGAFVDWDNTPRRGNNGSLFSNASPKMFEKYFDRQVKNAIEEYHSDKIFIFAWNEWAEGGYLEPDEKYGYEYLEAIKRVLLKYDKNQEV